MPRLTIATRRSPLALWQAEFVADQLSKAHSGLQVELLPMTTKGDQILDSPLSRIGGKGLFVKELEHALLDGRADLAVHSMKDVPAEFPEGLGLTAILEREDPRDALIGVESIDALPQGACVGTASLRRQLQIRARRPDLQIEVLRGNVNTRLAKQAEGQYSAIVLAASGLKRLGFEDKISHILSPEDMLPAIGQGALGIESRLDDDSTSQYLSVLQHDETHTRVSAERAFGACMGGSCQLPVAAYAEIDGEQLRLRGLLGKPDGSQLLSAEIAGPLSEAAALGNALGEQILSQGGEEILQALQEA